MATDFPGAIDTSSTLPYPSATDDTNSPSLSSGQSNQNDSVIATETKLGYGASNQTASSNTVLVGTGNGISQWAAITGDYTAGASGSGDFVLASGAALTNATLNTPTINNPTLNTDSVVGYTSPDTGTVYGIGISSGTITSSSSFGTSVILPSALEAGTGSSWVWQSWTPTWVNFSPGNATISALYIQTGKTVDYMLSVVLGSTSSISGGIIFSLPIPPISSTLQELLVGQGICNLRGGVYTKFFVTNGGGGSTQAYLYAESASTAYVIATPVTATVPITFTTNSVFCITGKYQVA